MKLRDRLANERTLLAYVRTALALVIAGLSVSRFFERPVLGWTLVGLGIITICAGTRRAVLVRSRIERATDGFSATDADYMDNVHEDHYIEAIEPGTARATDTPSG